MTDKEFKQREEELLRKLPPEFHAAVSWRAYDQGHAYGHSEVLSHVGSLVDMLEEPIAEYTKRLTAAK